MSVVNLKLIAQTHLFMILLNPKATDIVLAHQDVYFGSKFSGHVVGPCFLVEFEPWFPGSCELPLRPFGQKAPLGQFQALVRGAGHVLAWFSFCLDLQMQSKSIKHIQQQNADQVK